LASIALRYFLLILLGLGNLWLFYTIFTPLTVYPVFFVLQQAYSAVLLAGNTIFFKGYYASIIPACIAGAAYYALCILNLTTPMTLRKRLQSLIFLLAGFLIINTLRILIFAKLLFVGYAYFDLTHQLTWYLGSTALVILLWLASTAIFKIKAIPIYTDIKTILEKK
jgi:exosortase/archaeosortase